MIAHLIVKRKVNIMMQIFKNVFARMMNPDDEIIEGPFYLQNRATPQPREYRYGAIRNPLVKKRAPSNTRNTTGIHKVVLEGLCLASIFFLGRPEVLIAQDSGSPRFVHL